MLLSSDKSLILPCSFIIIDGLSVMSYLSWIIPSDRIPVSVAIGIRIASGFCSLISVR